MFKKRIKINFSDFWEDLIKQIIQITFSFLFLAVSFHDWINPKWTNDTVFCIEKLKSNGYEMIDLHQWGWRLFLKK